MDYDVFMNVALEFLELVQDFVEVIHPNLADEMEGALNVLHKSDDVVHHISDCGRHVTLLPEVERPTAKEGNQVKVMKAHL